MTPEECAYAAALLDGEGYIAITKGPAQGRLQVRYHRCEVTVGMCDPRPVLWLQARWPGGYFRAVPSEKWQTYYRVQFQGRNAERLLRDVRPYLVGKGEQADIIFAFTDTMLDRAGTRKLDESVIAHRDELQQELMLLHHLNPVAEGG